MSDVIEHLKRFNRKERFHLVRAALGNGSSDGDSFDLGSEFIEELGKCLRPPDLSVPRKAFAAMDYHLDWILLSLYLAGQERGESAHEINFKKGSPLERVNETQPDIDLLVAFESGGRTHLVLIEAKADTPWNNEQLKQKAPKLRGIFGDGCKSSDQVTPHFVLMSPKRPEKIETEGWPRWMKPNGEPIWIPLRMPESLLKATRSREKKGDPFLKLRIDPVPRTAPAPERT